MTQYKYSWFFKIIITWWKISILKETLKLNDNTCFNNINLYYNSIYERKEIKEKKKHYFNLKCKYRDIFI